MNNESKSLSKLDKTIWLWLTGNQNMNLKAVRPSPSQFDKGWNWFVGLRGDAFGRASVALRLRSLAYRKAKVGVPILSSSYALYDLVSLMDAPNSKKLESPRPPVRMA